MLDAWLLAWWLLVWREGWLAVAWPAGVVPGLSLLRCLSWVGLLPGIRRLALLWRLVGVLPLAGWLALRRLPVRGLPLWWLPERDLPLRSLPIRRLAIPAALLRSRLRLTRLWELL